MTMAEIYRQRERIVIAQKLLLEGCELPLIEKVTGINSKILQEMKKENVTGK